MPHTNSLINPSESCFHITESQRLVYILTDSGDVDIEVHLEQPEAEVEIYALANLRGDDHVSFKAHVYHHVGHTRSYQLIKSVLDESAVFSFVGTVEIERNAQQTQAQQTNRNLLLSPTAQVKTQPQLIIHADDVKASHGATTGQLDEQTLFYMQQRGLSRETAVQLLIDAFCEEITQYADL